MLSTTEKNRAIKKFGDQRWRLDNLYWIIDKEGKRVQFKLNWAQEQLFTNLHYLSVILKARQLGFTTFIQLYMLDQCIFNSNVRAGTIAHRLEDATTIFRDKVKYPYDNLPSGIKSAVPILRDSATELHLGNNSSIRVGVSHRSGTLNFLHVSEYGKLCAQYPEKAREVRTGALNTVQAGQIAFIESTAEGQEGHYYELCQDAQAKQRQGTNLTPLDFKFFFFPWWKNEEYELDPEGVVIGEDFAKYFRKLVDNSGIELNERKQAWYVKKAETQLEDMKREYPSTPEEAFEASLEGAYYANQLAQAELQGRIGEFPAVPNVLVETAWDIGVGDQTSIWFYQRLRPRIRFVGFIQGCGEGLPFYLTEMNKLRLEKGWQLGDALWPHDGHVTEWGTGLSREEQYRTGTGKLPLIIPRMGIDDGINAARAIFADCEFDQGPCAEGLKALRNYRKEWDEGRGRWRDVPLHNWASDGADAFRTMASRYKLHEIKAETPKPTNQPKFEVSKTGAVRQLEPFNMFEWAEARRKKRERSEGRRR